jgi:hypothetical protein
MSQNRALKAAIKDWKNKLKVVQQQRHPPLVSCALCAEFPQCKECPVHESTGFTLCTDTPYAELSRIVGMESDEAYWKLYKDIVKREIIFLESLL